MVATVRDRGLEDRELAPAMKMLNAAQQRRERSFLAVAERVVIIGGVRLRSDVSRNWIEGIGGGSGRSASMAPTR